MHLAPNVRIGGEPSAQELFRRRHMKFSKHLFYVATCGVATLALSVSANAQLSGFGGETTTTQAFASDLVFTPGTGFTFTANTSSLGAISFDAGGSNTLGAFVNSGGHLTTGNTSQPITGSVNTTLAITGSALFTTGEQITFTHDDGVNLYVGGTLFSNQVSCVSGCGSTVGGNDYRDATGSESTTFQISSAQAGLNSFEIVYNECCSLPAVLSGTIPNITSTPEPASIVLLATMLLGTGIVYRRRGKAA
jgi:hypothetical protein